MPTLLLADVLRSIHYGHPLTLSTLECLRNQGQLNSSDIDIYRTVLRGNPPTSVLDRDASMTVLVAILADIHTFAHVLHPLSLTTRVNSDSNSPVTLPHLFESHMAHIPFSATNGSILVRRKLSKALSVWATAYLANQSGEVSVLYHFCQMYLALPTLQTVTEQNPRLHPIKQK